MAKKAKRRGRPPGSKNRKSVGKSITTMDVTQLRAHIEDLQSVLSKKVSEQRAYFEGQLAQLGGYVSKKATAAFKAVTPEWQDRQARESEAEISVQEGQVGEVVRSRHDARLDARRDEGHQADQGQLPDQVAASRAPWSLPSQTS